MTRKKNAPVAAAGGADLRCGAAEQLLAATDWLADKSVRLACCDPPYDNGTPYDACDDNKGYEAYLAWTRDWARGVHRVLADDGALWLFIPSEWVSEIDLMLRQELKFYKRCHLIWAFTFGQAAQRNFTRSFVHLLYMTKRKTKFVFNEDAVRVPSARQLRYNDKRANPKGKLPDAVWMLLAEQLEPCMGPDRDAWLQSRICGTFKERRKVSPNQIPLPLLDRIIRVCSQPGDLVLDPFLGSGSTALAARQAGRRFAGCDLSQNCVDATAARLATS